LEYRILHHSAFNLLGGNHLRMETKQLRSFFQRHPIPMWIHDRKTLAILDANENLLADMGYVRTEFLGKTVRDILPKDEPPPPFFDIELNEHPVPVPAPLHINRGDGEVLRANLICQPLEHDGYDAVLVMVYIPRDQSFERRTIDARLRISEFSHTHTLDQLLQKTLDEAEALTGSTIGFFHFVEEDQITLWLQNWSTNTLKNMCTADGKHTHYGIDKAGVWVDCVRERRPVIYNDYPSLLHKKGLPPGHAHLTRILSIPILRAGKIIAIMGVGNKPTIYDDTDVQAARLLADLAWDITLAKRNEEALRASEYNFRSILEQASDGIFIADEEGRYIEVNQAGCDILGYPREEILEHTMQSILSKNDAQPLKLDELRDGKTLLVERTLVRKDGSPISVEISAKMLADGRMQGIVRDITERKREEERVRYLAFVMDRISNAVISTDADHNITHWNHAAEELYGWREEEVLGRNLDEVCKTEYAEGQKAEAQRCLVEEKRWRGEVRQRRRDDSELWASASITLLDGASDASVGFVTINHDITERKLAGDELRKTKETIENINRILQSAFEREQLASRTDSLTGAFNRRYFFEVLGHEIEVSRRYDRPLSVIMFDVDQFKQINDTCGHQAGDHVLKYIADMVNGQLRASDLLCRYGGDEFVILLSNSNEEMAAQVFKRIQASIQQQPFLHERKPISVTLSAGLASWAAEMQDDSQLLNQADKALYISKQSGRNRLSMLTK
jgi:diguanylate cyclase (GGDEF)-like protein/PAS domain S-box-containing protein